MLIPSSVMSLRYTGTSLSRRVNANSQLYAKIGKETAKLIKKGEC